MTEEDFHALGTLATKRVQDACNSVGQMLDSGEQALDMLLSIIFSMCNTAAELMRDHVVDEDGNKPPIEECFAEVLALLARGKGFTTERSMPTRPGGAATSEHVMHKLLQFFTYQHLPEISHVDECSADRTVSGVTPLTLACSRPSVLTGSVRVRTQRATGFRSGLPRHLLENSLYDAGTDAELLANLEDAITASPQL